MTCVHAPRCEMLTIANPRIARCVLFTLRSNVQVGSSNEIDNTQGVSRGHTCKFSRAD